MRCSEDTTHNVGGRCLLGQLASYCVLSGRPTKPEIPRPLIFRRPAVLHCMHHCYALLYAWSTTTSKGRQQAMRAYLPAANEDSRRTRTLSYVASRTSLTPRVAVYFHARVGEEAGAYNSGYWLARCQKAARQRCMHATCGCRTGRPAPACVCIACVRAASHARRHRRRRRDTRTHALSIEHRAPP